MMSDKKEYECTDNGQTCGKKMSESVYGLAKVRKHETYNNCELEIMKSKLNRNMRFMQLKEDTSGIKTVISFAECCAESVGTCPSGRRGRISGIQLKLA